MGQKYHFEIKTGDEYMAGTDSNIFIVLYGETGQLDEVRLNGYIRGNAFERNQTDHCDIEFDEDVGRIYQVVLRSDCKYGGSDWRLSYVKVSRCKNPGDADGLECNNASKFSINEWINNTNKRTYKVKYDQWSDNIAKYETVEVPYQKYRIAVPANSTYSYEKTVETTTEFQYTNIKTKKTTQKFNQEIGGSASYKATEAATAALETVKNFSGYLKFAFEQGFESTEVNQLVKTEKKTISETVKQDVPNKTGKQQEYWARFNLIKVNAISKSGDIVALFSGNSKVVFAGFELIENS